VLIFVVFQTHQNDIKANSILDIEVQRAEKPDRLIKEPTKFFLSYMPGFKQIAFTVNLNFITAFVTTTFSSY